MWNKFYNAVLEGVFYQVFVWVRTATSLEAKNKYRIHRKKSALQEKCSCREQLLSMVLGVSKSVRMGPLVETLLMMIPTQ